MAVLNPVHIMKSERAIPRYASTFTLSVSDKTTETKMAKVVSASFKESRAVALSTSELILEANFLLNKNSQSLISIETERITTDTAEKKTVPPFISFSTELLISSKPIIIISPDTIRADMYSNLPWP